MPEFDISVIVPIYNAEKYLGQCIDSILAQTKTKIEIILVDDGSTDGSRNIMESYARTNSNVVTVDNPQKGVIYARIEGLRRATGKYIGWVDLH